MPSSPLAAARRAPLRQWAKLTDEALLQLRFCDLPLRLTGTAVAEQRDRLYRDLSRRGIELRPHVWLAEEWFSPDGVPGIAVPFYLAHPRLKRLERHMMKQVEGGNRNWMMRIMRHEAGHAIDTAYRLRRRARWREVFGPASLPYPERYRARPGSRRYVHHLGDWYAQAHPTEDFAETFAVWLKPNSDWRRSYADWPARHKLLVVDEMMRELKACRPAVRSSRAVEPLRSNTRTLAEHYAEKLGRRQVWRRALVDAMLHRVFTAQPTRRNRPRAEVFLRTHRRKLVERAARDAGVDDYTAHQLLRAAIERAAGLGLYLRGAQRTALPACRWLVHSMIHSWQQGESPLIPL